MTKGKIRRTTRKFGVEQRKRRRRRSGNSGFEKHGFVFGIGLNEFVSTKQRNSENRGKNGTERGKGFLFLSVRVCEDKMEMSVWLYGSVGDVRTVGLGETWMAQIRSWGWARGVLVV